MTNNELVQVVRVLVSLIKHVIMSSILCSRTYGENSIWRGELTLCASHHRFPDENQSSITAVETLYQYHDNRKKNDLHVFHVNLILS
jgi:hypothetical protein